MIYRRQLHIHKLTLASLKQALNPESSDFRLGRCLPSTPDADRRGPLQPCGLASPPVGGVEVGGLEDGPLSLREGGGVEGGGVEGWRGGDLLIL